MPIRRVQPSAIAYNSAQTPLLQLLHERLSDYEDAKAHAQAIYSKYGVTSHQLAPPSTDLERRMQRTAETFDAVLEHVEDVDAHVAQDFVVLQRDAFGPANGLFSSRMQNDGSSNGNRQRMVAVPSVILAHSNSLKFAFPPRPSTEVLMHSRILANSNEARLLSAPPELLGLGLR